MRYYTFTNFMLSSIQQGIQPAHCVHETFVKYEEIAGPARDALWDWARNHKTMICLNGGNAQGIRDAYQQVLTFGEVLNLPYCKFLEDRDSLDCSMTCCGIVVPANIYEGAAVIRSTRDSSVLAELQLAGIALNSTEFAFAVWLNQFGLAK